MGGIVGGGKTPSIPAPTPMPVPDDEQERAARRRQAGAAQTRGGRASTILTDGGSGNTLGG